MTGSDDRDVKRAGAANSSPGSLSPVDRLSKKVK